MCQLKTQDSLRGSRRISFLASKIFSVWCAVPYVGGAGAAVSLWNAIGCRDRITVVRGAAVLFGAVMKKHTVLPAGMAGSTESV